MEKRFEKVVEWEKSPNYLLIVIGVILCIIPVVLVFFYWDYDPPGFIGNYYMLTAFIMHIFLGVIILAYSYGEGRKVYWKEAEEG